MIFYMMINIGSLSSIATTEMELHIGFWAAYLLPFLMFIVGFGILVAGKSAYKVRPPQGSVIPNAFRVCWIALKNKGNFEVAKPDHYDSNMKWDGIFVEEVKRAAVACKVFAFFPVYWVV